MIKLYLSVLFATGLFYSAFSQVVINEIQAGNTKTVTDPDFDEFADWIELYNSSETAVDLSGHTLTDDVDRPLQWAFPDGTAIPAKGRLIVWADNKDEGNALHANFSVSNNGDAVILFNAEGVVIDAINFGSIDDDKSFARKGDGGSVWGINSSPSPNAENSSTVSKMQAPEVLFSMPGGYYDDKQQIELVSFIPDGQIRYTTDGSMPSASSLLYEEPVSVSKNTVLKALVLHSEYRKGRVTMQTYFIGERKSNLPVVSLGVDPYDFFDETTGMYMTGPNASPWEPYDGANYWEDRELPVTFEYFVNGKQEVEVNAGIKIFGGWSRRFPQKSFSINCRKAYGDERMEYKFFKDKDINTFKQILLRNSGSQVDEVKYRDLMLQNLVKDQMDIDYQEGKAAIVYINGEYWGILNIREKLNERYLKDNYGLDQDNIDLLANYEEVIHGSSESFEQLFAAIENFDFSPKSKYANIENIIDANEYINYNIAEIYFGNHDWPGSNIKYWRTTNVDGKWRWILYDTDQSFAYYDYCRYDVNTLYDATNVIIDHRYWASDYEGTLFMSKFLENPVFRDEFIQRFCAHLNSTFTPERTKSFINGYEEMYEEEQPYHLERWGESDSVWDVQYDEMIEFAEKRPSYMFGFIKDYFKLSSPSTLNISSINNDKPQYLIKGVPSGGEAYAGKFFNNIPVTIEALPVRGYRFDHWEDESGGNISADAEIEITLTGNKSIKAVYEQLTKIENIYINEFMASNSTGITDSRGEYDDWIELYNDNDFAVEIGGLFVTDDFANDMARQISIGKSGETVIPAKGFIILWADSDENQGPLHVDMKLSAKGEQIGLFQKIGSEIHWIDSVSFPSQVKDISYGRKGDANEKFVHFETPTPNASNGQNAVAVSETIIEAEIYPTVVDDKVYVALKGGDEAQLEIYSAFGASVCRKLLYPNSLSVVKLENVKNGVYFVKVSNGADSKVERIIVRR